MPDHDGRALLARQTDRRLQLSENRFFRALVIQKHVPRNARQTDFLRLGCSDRLRAGAAVDKDFVATLQIGH